MSITSKQTGKKSVSPASTESQTPLSSTESLPASTSSRRKDTSSGSGDTPQIQYRIEALNPWGVKAVRVIRPLFLNNQWESFESTKLRAVLLASTLKDEGFEIEEQIAEPFQQIRG